MRRFEFTDDKSAKYWEIEQSDTNLNVRWGRIGTAGQSQTKNFADSAKASAGMLKLITEKTGKGYVELTTATGAAIGNTALKAASAKPAPSAVAPPAQEVPAAPAAPTESLDQQIERAFEAIRAQIAEAKVPVADGALSSAKIRRAHGISEVAAGQVVRHLINAGLIRSWDPTLMPNAQKIALHMVKDGTMVVQDERPSGAPADVAPWLAEGEPLRILQGADSTRRLARATRRHPQPVDLIDPQRGWQQVRTLISGSSLLDKASSLNYRR